MRRPSGEDAKGVLFLPGGCALWADLACGAGLSVLFRLAPSLAWCFTVGLSDALSEGCFLRRRCLMSLFSVPAGSGARPSGMTDPDLSDLPGLSDFSALPGFRGSVGVSPSLAELADLAALPKAEIHVHLEGTVSASTRRELVASEGLHLPQTAGVPGEK